MRWQTAVPRSYQRRFVRSPPDSSRGLQQARLAHRVIMPGAGTPGHSRLQALGGQVSISADLLIGFDILVSICSRTDCTAISR